jgi:hypothetical protein
LKHHAGVAAVPGLFQVDVEPAAGLQADHQCVAPAAHRLADDATFAAFAVADAVLYTPNAARGTRHSRPNAPRASDVSKSWW